MIKLSGFKVKDKTEPDGDIEIKLTGLRPGEKLYEELLIGDNPQKTNHFKIQKTNDPYIPFEQLESDLNNLKKLLDNNQVLEIKNLLNRVIKLYQSNSEIVDHIYTEQLFSERFQKEPIFSNNKENKVIKIK